MMLIAVFVNTIVFALLCLVVLVVLPSIVARSACLLFPKLISQLSHINIAKLSLLPFYCKELHADFTFGKTIVSIQFKDLQIILNLLDERRGLLHFDIHGLHISIEELKFPDVMASSPSATTESFSSEMKKCLARLISFQFVEISFEVKMADTDHVVVQGIADRLTVFTSRSNESSSHVLVHLEFLHGGLSIHQAENLVFSYQGILALADVHYQVFSRRMLAYLNTKG